MQTLPSISNTSVVTTSGLPATEVSATDVLGIYIASAGLIFLCLERINHKFYDITNPALYKFTEVDLYRTLSQPQVLRQLQDQTRAQIVMRTFEAANQAIQVATAKLGSQEPFEAAKTAANLIAQLETLTKETKANEFNINNFVWETLVPADAQAAIAYLQNNPQQPSNIIEHTSD